MRNRKVAHTHTHSHHSPLHFLGLAISRRIQFSRHFEGTQNSQQRPRMLHFVVFILGKKKRLINRQMMFFLVLSFLPRQRTITRVCQ
jgi:hypothetical protein